MYPATKVVGGPYIRALCSGKIFIVVLLCFSLALSPALADEEEKKGSGFLTRSVQIVCLATLFSVTVWGVRNHGHSLIFPTEARAKRELDQGNPELFFQVTHPRIRAAAWERGNIHAGNGIVLDVNKLDINDPDSIWNEKEREILRAKRTKKNQRQVIKLLLKRLFNPATNKVIPVPIDRYDRARFVSQFLQGAEGACKDKTIALVAAARYFRIRSEYMYGRVADLAPELLHVWAHFPELDIIADSVHSPLLYRRSQYHQRNDGFWVRPLYPPVKGPQFAG